MLFSKLQKTIENLIKKAQDDESFKKKLLKDSNALVEKELGEPLPKGLEIDINEATINTFALLSYAEDLTELQLQDISGGGGSSGVQKPIFGNISKLDPTAALAIEMLRGNPGLGARGAMDAAKAQIANQSKK